MKTFFEIGYKIFISELEVIMKNDKQDNKNQTNTTTKMIVDLFFFSPSKEQEKSKIFRIQHFP